MNLYKVEVGDRGFSFNLGHLDVVATSPEIAEQIAKDRLDDTCYKVGRAKLAKQDVAMEVVPHG